MLNDNEEDLPRLRDELFEAQCDCASLKRRVERLETLQRARHQKDLAAWLAQQVKEGKQL